MAKSLDEILGNQVELSAQEKITLDAFRRGVALGQKLEMERLLRLLDSGFSDGVQVDASLEAIGNAFRGIK